MPIGIVRRWDAARGIGFVRGITIVADTINRNSEDDMVLRDRVEGEARLRPGELVEYERVRGPKGWLAVNVRTFRKKVKEWPDSEGFSFGGQH